MGLVFGEAVLGGEIDCRGGGPGGKVQYADSSERIERRNGGRFLQVEEPHDLQEDFMLVEARSLGFA